MSGRGIVVVGAGASNLKSTVAVNLVAALATLDVTVALADADGASTAALAAEPGRGALGDAIQLPWWPRSVRLAATPVALADEVLVIDPPPRLGPATASAIDAAALVLVPVDATPLAFRVLHDVSALIAASGSSPILRAALARRLPRETDRWALVDRLDAEVPGALLHSTLPMSRPAIVGRTGRHALLYAPGTAASRSYERLALELLRVLGVALSRPTSSGSASLPAHREASLTPMRVV